MTPSEYERVTSQIAQMVFERAESSESKPNVAHGAKSKWKGQSGFAHQIDVAVEGESDIILVECKFWRKKEIKPEHLLTFIARVCDIAPTTKKQLHPVMVTSSRFSRGCWTLAKHFGVDLQRVSSLKEFVFEYRGFRYVGLSPGVGRSSTKGLRPVITVKR